MEVSLDKPAIWMLFVDVASSKKVYMLWTQGYHGNSNDIPNKTSLCMTQLVTLSIANGFSTKVDHVHCNQKVVVPVVSA